MPTTVIEDLVVSLELESSLEKDTRKAKGELEGLYSNVAVAGRRIGAAMTAAGASIIALSELSRKTNAQLNVTAVGLGLTTERMRELALETTNVTFPLSEVTASFDLLTRAGLRDENQIARVASAYDNLGDAVGRSASQVTSTMIVAFKTFNLTAEESTGYIDQMTFLLRNSTVEMENLDSVLAYTTPDLVRMGLSLDDLIASLIVMERQGSSGAVVTRNFRSAVTSATSDVTDYGQELLDLGTKLETLKGKQEDLTTSTRDNSLSIRQNEINLANAKDQYAEIVAEGKRADETTAQYNRRLEEQSIRIEYLTNSQDDLLKRRADLESSLTDNLRAQAENVSQTEDAIIAQENQTAAIDEFFTTLGVTRAELEAVKGEMADATGITDEFSAAANTQYGIMDKLGQAWSEFTLASGSALAPLEPLGVALSASGPLLIGIIELQRILPYLSTTSIPTLGSALTFLSANPIVLIIAAVAAIVVALIILEEKFGLVTKAVDFVTSAFSSLVDWLGNIWDSFTKTTDESETFANDGLLLLLGPIGLVILAFKNWDQILPIVTGIFDSIIGYIEGFIDWILTAGTRIMEAIVEGILNGPSPVNFLLDTLGLGSIGGLISGGNTPVPAAPAAVTGGPVSTDLSVTINNPIMTDGANIAETTRQISDVQRDQILRAGLT
jgi:hypothetical protein